jgi:hypothetical protein
LRIEGGIGFILIATSATVLRWDPETLSLRNTATTNATNTTRFGIPMISWRVVKSRVVVAKVSWCHPCYILLGKSDDSQTGSSQQLPHCSLWLTTCLFISLVHMRDGWG